MYLVFFIFIFIFLNLITPSCSLDSLGGEDDDDEDDLSQQGGSSNLKFVVCLNHPRELYPTGGEGGGLSGCAMLCYAVLYGMNEKGILPIYVLQPLQVYSQSSFV